MLSLVLPCVFLLLREFALHFSFANGTAKCVWLPGEVKAICPFYDYTVEGHLTEIVRNIIIHHFKALFMVDPFQFVEEEYQPNPGIEDFSESFMELFDRSKNKSDPEFNGFTR